MAETIEASGQKSLQSDEEPKGSLCKTVWIRNRAGSDYKVTARVEIVLQGKRIAINPRTTNDQVKDDEDVGISVYLVSADEGIENKSLVAYLYTRLAKGGGGDEAEAKFGVFYNTEVDPILRVASENLNSSDRFHRDHPVWFPCTNYFQEASRRSQ